MQFGSGFLFNDSACGFRSVLLRGSEIRVRNELVANEGERQQVSTQPSRHLVHPFGLGFCNLVNKVAVANKKQRLESGRWPKTHRSLVTMTASFLRAYSMVNESS